MIDRAQAIVEACRAISRLSDSVDNTTRTYLSPATQHVQTMLSAWMVRLGIAPWIDAAGNLRGLHRGRLAGGPRLLIGSHIDTVPNAGAFDGVLGVVLALSLVEALDDHRLDYDIELIAFSEEEGVRFRVPFIGSRALIGNIDLTLLRQKDADGITLEQAIADFGLDASKLPFAAMHPHTFAFIEFHIEQGPLLENLNISLGIVEAIAGQSRYDISFYGQANHAGTTPMHLRHDALAGAAEWILAVEESARKTADLVATIGQAQALPGVSNVIPGEARLSLDIRHAKDMTRLEAVETLLSKAHEIATLRCLAITATQHFDQPATAMNPVLASALESAAIATGSVPHRMISGAGHDAMVIARKVPAAMLFVRSPGGISHHPDETVRLDDVQAALEAGLYFLKHLDPEAVASKGLQHASETPSMKGLSCKNLV